MDFRAKTLLGKDCMEESLYPFFDDTDKPHMAAAWKNVHYTDLAGSIVFDTLSDTLLVGCEEEHLSRVRVYAWAVGAHHKIKLEGLGSHNPVYTYNESGRVQSITLRAREYAADSLPRIVELGNMVDDTGMMTVYVVRVGIEPVLAVEAPADILEEALLPNLKGLSIPRARILEAPVVFRAALVYPNLGTRVILPLGKNHYQLEEHDSHMVFSVNENARRLIPWIMSYTSRGTDPVRLEVWWEPEHELMLRDGAPRYGS